jgi:carboxypeptidase Q
LGATSPQSLSAPLGANLDRRHSLGGGDDIREVQKAGVPLVLPGQDGSIIVDIHHTADDPLDKIDPKQLNQPIAVRPSAITIAP